MLLSEKNKSLKFVGLEVGVMRHRPLPDLPPEPQFEEPSAKNNFLLPSERITMSGTSLGNVSKYIFEFESSTKACLSICMTSFGDIFETLSTFMNRKQMIL